MEYPSGNKWRKLCIILYAQWCSLLSFFFCTDTPIHQKKNSFLKSSLCRKQLERKYITWNQKRYGKITLTHFQQKYNVYRNLCLYVSNFLGRHPLTRMKIWIQLYGYVRYTIYVSFSFCFMSVSFHLKLDCYGSVVLENIVP
jgi:hypothetical protein